jgi:hypothetical protein
METFDIVLRSNGESTFDITLYVDTGLRGRIEFNPNSPYTMIVRPEGNRPIIISQ